jgi:subtilisin family serine protease
VVCSAGNDAIDRPSFPASLWAWPGADNGIASDKHVPLVSVGAINPSQHSLALFSNVGPWVRTYAPGAVVVSTTPAFTGGTQAVTRADAYGFERQTVDPDDYRGGFAAWSGTSFAAPYVAGKVAALLGTLPPDAGATAAAAKKAVKKVLAALPPDRPLG